MPNNGMTADTTGLDPVLEALLIEAMHKRLVAEAVQAQIEQELLAREFREAKAVNGLGELKRRVHGTAFHHWGQDLGYDCWHDRGFTRYFDKIAPECKIQCRGTKVQIGFSQPVEFWKPFEPSGNKRFAKTYVQASGRPNETECRSNGETAIPDTPTPRLADTRPETRPPTWP